MILRVYTDGGSINNPGKAASAYLIYQDNLLIFQEGKKIGTNTNNVAEYQALIMAWEKVVELYKKGDLDRVDKIEFIADSLLLVNQLLGFYKVKNQTLKKYYLKIKALEKNVSIKYSYKHVLRNYNQKADSLVKQALYS